MGLRAIWRQSTLLRVSVVLGVIALLALTVVITAGVFTERSVGKGAAINVAGSLRMQTYLLATRVASADTDLAERQRLILGEVEAFEQRLASPRLTGALPVASARRAAVDAGGEARDLAGMYGEIAAQWRDDIRPLALRAGTDEAARAALLGRVHGFVALIDRFVFELESDLESRIHGLQVALGVALFVTIVLVISAVLLLDVEVFQPVRDLVRSAREVRRGNFATRVEKVGPDELGELGGDFNHMVEALGGLYGNLEAQIAAKTADLEQKNRSLELLYDTARKLAQPELRRASLQQVAEQVRGVLGVQGVVICARGPQTHGGFSLAQSEQIAGRTCDIVKCEGCDGGAQVVRYAAGPEHGNVTIVSIPLIDGERALGVMPLTLAPGQQLDSAQVELAQAVARHVAGALAADESREDHRRLALLEERSAIARELHDSIAQTLTYTKIQLARLSALMSGDAARSADAAALEVVDELRNGVSTAYAQLRELLTTFRLQLVGKGLHSALVQVADDLRRRCPVTVELNDELVGPELSANEQIHLLQIVREALANVEHHAQATHAWVDVVRTDDADGRHIEVRIDDDGIGIASDTAPRHHFGLAIMRDRARALGGVLEIGRRDPCGTRVRLRFVPQADRPNEAASAAGALT